MAKRIIPWIRGFFRALWNSLSLILVLSVTATIPIVQLASLGYMLESSGRVANGLPVRRCFPGAGIAGAMVSRGVWLVLSWLPVWFLADLAYSAELIEPGSDYATRMRIAARVLAVAWVVWASWALVRGGRLWHFLWPAPKLFFRTVFTRRAWHEIEDKLWDFVASLRFPYLMKIGFYGTVGALLWLILPAILMIIALTSPADGALGFIGFLGAVGMWWLVLFLPYLPVHMASQNRFRAIFDWKEIRRAFRRAPFAFCLALSALVALAIPLYLLRIESIPSQLLWILSLFFVILMFPVKLLAGWALRCSRRRSIDRHWLLRWSAWLPQASVAGIYVGFLYLAKFTLWEGAASILLQHAFLPPVPFYLR